MLEDAARLVFFLSSSSAVCRVVMKEMDLITTDVSPDCLGTENARQKLYIFFRIPSLP